VLDAFCEPVEHEGDIGEVKLLGDVGKFVNRKVHELLDLAVGDEEHPDKWILRVTLSQIPTTDHLLTEAILKKLLVHMGKLLNIHASAPLKGTTLSFSKITGIRLRRLCSTFSSTWPGS